MSRALARAAARHDFFVFARLAFDVLHPGTVFEDNWHLRAIAAMLEEARVSHQWRQLVTMAPRTLKSFMISIAFTAYLLGRDPTTRLVCASYGDKLAEELSDLTRRLMTSEFYQEVFPKTRLRSDTKLKLVTTKGGMRFATSLSGAVTGFGGDWVIIDDPMNASEAHSEAARERVKREFDHAMSSRVNNETMSNFVVVMQRLHDDDLAGHLLATGDWAELRLQARATEAISVDIGAGEMYEVKVGQLLHPSRLPAEVLDRKLRQLGSADFQAQYQQDPVPAEGVYLKREWLTYYDTLPSRDDAEVIISLDTALKTNPENDYSVATVWLLKDNKHYLMHVWRDKLQYPFLKKKVLELYEQFDADILLIEDQGNGITLIQDLNQKLTVIACPTPEGKIPRFIGALGPIEAGNMLLPRNAPWRAPLESELLKFPNGRHDDQADSVSQYFRWARTRKPPGKFEFSFI